MDKDEYVETLEARILEKKQRLGIFDTPYRKLADLVEGYEDIRPNGVRKAYGFCVKMLMKSYDRLLRLKLAEIIDLTQQLNYIKCETPKEVNGITNPRYEDEVNQALAASWHQNVARQIGYGYYDLIKRNGIIESITDYLFPENQPAYQKLRKILNSKLT